MSADLVAFLRARLDEDEATARAVRLGAWVENAYQDEVIAADGCTVADVFAHPIRATVDHIARHDPARVLREVEAKRRIVELRDAWAAAMSPAPSADLAARFADQVHAADMILRLLALPYADHPDYREEWKP